MITYFAGKHNFGCKYYTVEPCKIQDHAATAVVLCFAAANSVSCEICLLYVLASKFFHLYYKTLDIFGNKIYNYITIFFCFGGFYAGRLCSATYCSYRSYNSVGVFFRGGNRVLLREQNKTPRACGGRQ